MKYFGAGLSEKHSALSRIIRKKEYLEQAKSLFSEIHAAVNMPCVYGGCDNEVSRLFCGLPESSFAVMPTAKDETIAWSLWHIARIEDITVNMLIARNEQLFDDSWRERIGSPVTDTGNAMTDEEMIDFSKAADVKALLDYRNAVATRTRDVVAALSYEDMRRKVSQEDIRRIAECGGVTDKEQSLWLLDYWSGKDIAGLLLMPPTRHTMLHLNSCARVKYLIETRKSLYKG